jgi:hypothetical protein
MKAGSIDIREGIVRKAEDVSEGLRGLAEYTRESVHLFRQSASELEREAENLRVLAGQFRMRANELEKHLEG